MATATQYIVRDARGESIGPLPPALIVDLIYESHISANAQVQRAFDGAPTEVVAIDAIPAFASALQKRALIADDSEVGDELDAAGLAPHYLRLAKAKAGGWLRVKSAGGLIGIVSICEGRIIQVRTNQKRAAVGQLLLADGCIDDDDLQRAIHIATEIGVPLGTALVDLTLVRALDVEVALNRQAHQRLTGLFRLTSGEVRFYPSSLVCEEEPFFDDEPALLVRSQLQKAGDEFCQRALLLFAGVTLISTGTAPFGAPTKQEGALISAFAEGRALDGSENAAALLFLLCAEYIVARGT